MGESLQPQATAFDTMAERYDTDFTASAVGRALRAIVWRKLDARFAGCETLLELGCGTGEDAVHLASLGHRVVATDASAGMLAVARRKSEHAGVADRIRFIHVPMESLVDVLGDEKFAGVYSNFGAINCAVDVPALARVLASRLGPRAPLLFVAMGRHVPWEWAWFLARGDRARAFRRLARSGVEWRGMRIHYPSPAMLERALAPCFEAARCSALGFILPPGYAAGWLERSPRLLSALSVLEHAASRFAAGLADHYILEARRA